MPTYPYNEHTNRDNTAGSNDIKPIDYDNLVANYKHYRKLFHDLAHTLNDRTGEHHHHARDNDIIVHQHDEALVDHQHVLDYDDTDATYYDPADHTHDHDTRGSD